MPSGGSVSADVVTSLLRLGGVFALFVIGVAALVLLLRWLTGQLQLDRLARRRAAEEAGPALESVPRPEQGPEPGRQPGGDPRPHHSPAARHPAADHHPVGRRVPGPQMAVPARPRRPLELVAADVRRLTHELAMVPGGMPMARRRGLLAAYDDVLVEAAELLEVPQQLTSQPPVLRELERMRLLGCLEAAGLVVAD